MKNNIKINKLLVLMLIVISTIFFSSCNKKETLLFLNWGEYINDDVVKSFEEKYNCNVVIDIAESNELFYSKLKSGTTAYDLCAPSDYMIEKMKLKGLIRKIDFTQLKNYDRNQFLSPVRNLMDDMEKEVEDINSYHVPYFWGTFGIMYNKQKGNIESLLNKKDGTGGWNAFFNIRSNDSSYKVGMYNVPRFAYAATMLYNNLDPNSYNDENLEVFKNTLLNSKFNEWGTDTLKKGIESGNLDLAFVYTGDCLDMIYLKIEDGVKVEDLNFDIYIPEKTILHMDSLVIPENARHVELAHKFIDYLLEKENAYLNASVVGYCTPLVSSYKMIVDRVNINSSTSESDAFWYDNWAKAVEKYYQLEDDGSMNINGVPLSFFDTEELTKIGNIVNNVKSK